MCQEWPKRESGDPGSSVSPCLRQAPSARAKTTLRRPSGAPSVKPEVLALRPAEFRGVGVARGLPVVNREAGLSGARLQPEQLCFYLFDV